MDQPPPSAAEPPRNHDRLNGWKEIASHFGKSVRTVQRWEKELRLPVHRIHTPNGEIVFALADELAAWQAANESTGREEDADPSDSGSVTAAQPRPLANARGRNWLRFALLWAIAAAVSIGGWELFRTIRAGRVTDRQPAAFRVEDDRIVILNSAGQALWPYILKPPHSAEHFRPVVAEHLHQYLKVEDLDGDGHREVLISLRPALPQQHELVCLESDGNVRFILRMPRTVLFGGEVFDPPFLDPAMELVSEPSGAKTLWVRWNHHAMFPSALQKVTSKGEPQGEFWANGHIMHMAPTTRNGRRVMLLTAFNNERLGVTLAALDYENPAGSMPADNPKYRCADCPPRPPLDMLVFPRMEISRIKDARPMPGPIKLGGGGSVMISVDHFREPIAGEKGAFEVASAIYAVNNAWEVVSAETTDSYRMVHAKLRLSGLINHEYGPRDERELLPVLRWDGARFRPQPLKPPTAKQPTSPSLALNTKPQRRRKPS